MFKSSLCGVIFAASLVLPVAAGAATGGGPVGNMPSQRIINSQPNGSGASLTISPARVRRVQQALNRLGYNAGAISGSWDQKTARAMQSFQAAHGLAPTGNLNATTLSALGLGGGASTATASNGGQGGNGPRR